MTLIAEHLQQLDSSIEALCAEVGRDRREIKLIAVSKTRSLQEVRQAIDAGQRCFGHCAGCTVQDS